MSASIHIIEKNDKALSLEYDEGNSTDVLEIACVDGRLVELER